MLDAVSDLCAGAIGAYIAYQYWNLLGVILAMPFIAVVILCMGELAPLTIAQRKGVSVALFVSRPLRWLVRILGAPLGAIERLAGVIPEASLDLMAAFTSSEVREMGVLNTSTGLIEEHERQLIERAFRLNETKAWNIMTPRVDIVALEGERTLAQVALELGTIRYSRVPVYGETSMTSQVSCTSVMRIRP